MDDGCRCPNNGGTAPLGRAHRPRCIRDPAHDPNSRSTRKETRRSRTPPRIGTSVTLSMSWSGGGGKGDVPNRLMTKISLVLLMLSQRLLFVAHTFISSSTSLIISLCD